MPPTNISTSYLSLLSPFPFPLPRSCVSLLSHPSPSSFRAICRPGVCVEIFFKGTAEKWFQDGKHGERVEKGGGRVRESQIRIWSMNKCGGRIGEDLCEFLHQPSQAGAKGSILLSCFSHVFLWERRRRRHACVHQPYPPAPDRPTVDRSAITTELLLLLLKLAVRLLKERGREGGRGNSTGCVCV